MVIYQLMIQEPHFGLGAVTKIDSLVVEWPDGKRNVLTNVDVDKTITIDYKNAVDQKSFNTNSANSFY